MKNKTRVIYINRNSKINLKELKKSCFIGILSWKEVGMQDMSVQCCKFQRQIFSNKDNNIHKIFSLQINYRLYSIREYNDRVKIVVNFGC